MSDGFQDILMTEVEEFDEDDNDPESQKVINDTLNDFIQLINQ